MWISRRTSSREIDNNNNNALLLRSSSKRTFIHSSFKDVENLLSDDVTGLKTLDQPSTCSAAVRRLSVFHRVHLATKFARAFHFPPPESNKLTAALNPVKSARAVHFPLNSLPESNNLAAAAVKLVKSDCALQFPAPESNKFTEKEKLVKSDSAFQFPAPESNILGSKSARAFYIPNKSPPESNNHTAAEKLVNSDIAFQFPVKSPPESNNLANKYARAVHSPVKSPPESNNFTSEGKIVKSDNAFQFPVKSPPESNNLANEYARAVHSPVKPSPESNNHTAAEKLVNSDRAIHSPVKYAPESNNLTAADIFVKSDRQISIPGAESRIVIYTTSLRVVRSTFEACRTVQSILRTFRVLIDERDLSMDSRFVNELHEIMAEGVQEESEKTKLTLPRVFIGGRYIGGAEEVKQLHETGELKKVVEGLPAVSSVACEGCGEFKYILCDACRGSRKCYTEKGGFRSCTLCNENGLVRCTVCLGR